ncbi:transcriptional regulator, GntR family [Jatrophihabitans endophyticus]|uniref:Transcriptional regulator, GntR family n=1 Tax=Jatrophihabitans endophyticus TaxID=1206085 RepID=A0A1M5SSF5_9ACTN|nr:GntR family transcriptional regulator [Jatrophihabitans endophyticus]SHH40863.1 transcriptional regulator, GntR family [Jatrophihabitans endophyticus]
MPIRADQVERYVRDLAEQLGPGAVLPGERELAHSCGVSRMTVRRALDELEERRVVERRHGAGTFVRRPAAAQPLMATSFHEDMRRRGFAPASSLVDTGTQRASAGLAAQLEIAEGDPVLVVRRLRLADADPIALETLHVPVDRTPGLAGEDLADGSYYAVLRERFGRRVASGRQTVSPVVPPTADTDLLGVPTGTAVFRFVRISRDHHGDVVELVDALYRADRYLIEVDILPPSEGKR